MPTFLNMAIGEPEDNATVVVNEDGILLRASAQGAVKLSMSELQAINDAIEGLYDWKHSLFQERLRTEAMAKEDDAIEETKETN